MIIDFPVTKDDKDHWYCVKCHSQNLTHDKQNGMIKLNCHDCGASEDRSIHIGPDIEYWIDPVTKKYWHESVGAFVFNQNNELLLFDRTAFPYAYAIPAGHLDSGEVPFQAALRELEEETGIKLNSDHLKHFATIDISGDSCRRGSDDHRWNIYVGYVNSDKIRLDIDESEGRNPTWRSIQNALEVNLVYPVRYILEKYGEKLYSIF